VKLTFFFCEGCAKCKVTRPLFEDVCAEFGIEFEAQNVETESGLAAYWLLLDKELNLPVAVFEASDGKRTIFQSALDFERLLQVN
jgi:thiol-disulfide isomerase/thioredoxin